MASIYNLIKTFNAWKGIDLRSSDITRTAEYASELKNVQYRKTGAMEKRKGFQFKTKPKGGCGLHNYVSISNTNLSTIEELVTADANLHKIENGTVNITYSGSNTAYLNIEVLEEDRFVVKIFENNTLLETIELGKGFEEIAPITMNNLITSLNGVTGFAATGTGELTTPAAFLSVQSNVILNNIPKALNFKYFTQIDSALPNMMQANVDNITDSNYEICSFANSSNVMYIASKYHDLLKYDGTRLYKAGIPKANIDSATALLAGNVPLEPTYIAVFRYTDAQGNIITGIESDPITVTANDSQVQIDIESILNTSGYDTQGDLQIELYRNKFGGQSFFLVDEFNNIDTTPLNVYVDNKADADLTFEYIVPIKQHGIPPKLSYITIYQGLLVGTGNPESPNTVYYSDIDSPEYFPPGDNSFETESMRGEANSAIASLGNSLFSFKDNSIYQILGNLAEDSFSVDYYGQGDIGCVAHASIQEVNGFLMFLSLKGVYSLNQNNQKLEQVSQLIDPLFTSFKTDYTFKRAVAKNWLAQDKYILHVPTIDNEGASQEDSDTLVYDYLRGAWLPWTNINLAAGITLFEGELYFQEAQYEGFSDSITSKLGQFLNTGSKQDYCDHGKPIDFIYKSHWEHMSEPSIFKKFLRTKVHSLDSSLDDFESDGFLLDLESEVDWITNISTQRQLDFRGGSEGWGTSAWGLFPWGNERLNSFRTKMKSVKCKSLRLILKNSELNENVLISGIEMEVAAPYGQFIKE